MFGFSSVEEFCKAIHLPPSNCTCEAMGIIASEDTPDFCKRIRESSKDKRSGLLVLPLIITIIAIFALIGNTIVVWVQTSKFAKKSRHTYLITFLALCDMFFAIFILVYYVPKFSSNHWIYGLIGCKIVSGSITLGAWVAIGIILVIAIERFFGIVYPFRRGMTNIRMYSFLLINVFVAICFLIPRIIHLQIQPETLDCQEDWAVEHMVYLKVYGWSMFLFYSIVPVTAISVLYFMIFRSLKHSMLKCQVEGNQHMAHINAERLRNNRRSMILLVPVLVAFVLCTFPNKIRWLILSVVPSLGISIKDVIKSPYLMAVTEIMYPIHLAINPLIYAMADNHFRKMVKLRVLSLFGKHKTAPGSRRTESIHLHSFNKPVCQGVNTG